jgi:glycosyltransferase involved in cell wall biosynthesis
VLCSDSQEIDAPRRWWKEWVKRRLVARYDAGFASGTRAKAYLQKLGLPEDRIATGYDAIDNAFFAQRAAAVQAEATSWRSRLGLPQHFFLAVGRMIPKKGFPFLVRTYGRYIEAERAAGRDPWGMVIIGDGPERAAIEAERARLPDPGQVLLPGYLTNEQASVYFGLASVFVMPSLYAEQWGLVVNEAMAAGLPVLASEICGATPDLVVDGRTGFSFPAGDEAKLAERMIWCSARTDQMPVLGVAARAQVEAFSTAYFATKLFDLANLAAAHAAAR